MRHFVRGAKVFLGLCLLGYAGFVSSAVSAEDASPPKSTATRPVKERTGEISLPDTAPPATGSQTTGSTNQDPTTKKMNEEEKKKLDIEGK
jgi:hypothetical protein